MTLVLTALLVAPLAPLAHARCHEASHPCAPAPVLVACCCVLAADAEQTSLNVGVVTDHLSAAGGTWTGQLIWMPTQVALAHSWPPDPSPPIHRLALFSQLLI